MTINQVVLARAALKLSAILLLAKSLTANLCLGSVSAYAAILFCRHLLPDRMSPKFLNTAAT